ncbi:ATP-binding protein [Rhodobacterales bacterium HKCCE3408]|nr:ATP-binding protein [Rhodobacterales bacterium HKCCE3408]
MDGPATKREDGAVPRLCLSFAPLDGAVRGALADIHDHLAARTDPDLLARVEIALAETLNNIAEHAYCGRDRVAGEIAIALHGSSRSLDFEIVDDGREMPGGSPPPGHLPQVDGVPVDQLPEGGFGWHLIRRLSTGLAYERRGGRNHVTFRISA